MSTAKFTTRDRSTPIAFARIGVALAAVLVLSGPALWNGFPLLEYDTGGYLARWHEGYLVPSRPAPYGLLLNIGSFLDFWPVLIVQAAMAVWVMTLVMRITGLRHQPRARFIVFIAMAMTTTLPWIASVLLTDIFAGLAVLGLHLIVFKADDLTPRERRALMLLIAFSIATHSATLLLMLALGLATMLVSLLNRRLISPQAVTRAAASVALGIAMLLTANFIVAGRIAWTPGGYGIVFGRLLEDGIVNMYLDKHCPDQRLQLCDYRNELPRDADMFLWGNSVFDALGQFDGLGNEMRTIVLESIVEYPVLHAETALRAAMLQLVSVKSGEGVLDTIWHTYGMLEKFAPSTLPALRAARQQHGELQFETINKVHVPIALAAMVLLLVPIARGAWRRRATDFEMLAATAAFAILVNACILGPLSNPHDRYGARLVWIAPFVVALWPWQRREHQPPPGDRR